MKIIAHRGWSSSKNENTINSFEKSLKEKGVSGVEIDIRRSLCGKKIVISHDPVKSEKTLTLEKGLKFLSKYNHELFIEMKECDDDFFYTVVDLLEKYNLKKRSLIFAFRDVAEKFIGNNCDIKLGMISEYPWNIKKDIEKFNPNFILMGWDERWWTKITFKFVWSFLSLKRLCKKYNKVNFVVGVVDCKSDYNWVKKQNGLYGCTADKPFEWRN